MHFAFRQESGRMTGRLLKWCDATLVAAIRFVLRAVAHSPLLASGEAVARVVDTVLPLVSRAATGTEEQAESMQLALRSLLVSSLPPDARHLVPALLERTAPVRNTWTYQNESMQWAFGPDDKILDVGSGGWPFRYATHLADKYPDRTTHRVEAIVTDQRPFFEVDLEKLPFKDKAYDFVFCSHVLEHMGNPGVAMRELMRVARKGYIEVPTRLSDVMFNFTRLPNHHRWHGLVVGTTIVLIEWNDWERRDLGNDFFDALHSSYANPFQDFFERNRDLFFASCHWTETIDFLIIDRYGKVIDSSAGM
jgi:SAM-dependent methyltransferase